MAVSLLVPVRSVETCGCPLPFTIEVPCETIVLFKSFAVYFVVRAFEKYLYVVFRLIVYPASVCLRCRTLSANVCLKRCSAGLNVDCSSRLVSQESRLLSHSHLGSKLSKSLVSGNTSPCSCKISSTLFKPIITGFKTFDLVS